MSGRTAPITLPHSLKSQQISLLPGPLGILAPGTQAGSASILWGGGWVQSSHVSFQLLQVSK